METKIISNPRIAVEMMQDRFFAGFDFTDYWEFAGENGYKFPTLRKE